MANDESASRFRTVEVSDPRFEVEGLRQVTVKSARLGGRGDVTLHVPSKARGGRDLPVVLLLHGIYGSHWAWAWKGGAHRTNERLSASGEIAPMILAMPSDGLRGDGSGYVRHSGPDFERWIVEDVPALVREVVPEVGAGSRVFIAGLSMGGFGALRLGARYPGVFSGISGLSSATHLDQLRGGVEENLDRFGADTEQRGVLEALIGSARRPPLRFECGTEDFLIGFNRELHRELEGAGIVHQYEEHPGGHTWEYWERRLPDTLRYFSGLAG